MRHRIWALTVVMLGRKMDAGGGVPVTRRRSVLVFGLVLLVATVVVAASAPETRTVSAETAWVSFVRGPSIYLVSFEGRRVSRVLRGSESPGSQGIRFYFDPAWSRDGSRLAVSVNEGSLTTYIEVFRQKKPFLFVPYDRSVDDCTLSSVDRGPAWAPDGRRIVFASIDYGLCLWRWASKKTAPLTPFPPGGAYESPAWSTDGSEIAFTRARGARELLYVMRSDGRNTRQVTKSEAENPSWSPDGRRLVFDDGRRIAIVDANGRNFKYLTQPKTRDLDPAWSPDGRWIVFARYHSKPSKQSTEYDPSDLWVVDTGGGSLRLLTRNANSPTWRAQGSRTRMSSNGAARAAIRSVCLPGGSNQMVAG
jgi:Tol biopolymer transport system component